MAFVEKAGSRFAVKQGNTGKVLATFSSQKAANAKVAQLHRENNPASGNRGGTAKRMQGKSAQKAKTAGKKKPSRAVKARKNSSAARSRRSAPKHRKR